MSSFYDLNAKTLAGQDQPLSAYRGKVALVVNVASECGLTPQYAGLEKLYETMEKEGLVVLGFPSNEFGGQEPGSPEQIQTFCRSKYGIKFPMFEKVETKGPGKHPVYAFLTKNHDEPKWNFHKYLIGKDGRVIASFSSRLEPDSAEVNAAIEKALAE